VNRDRRASFRWLALLLVLLAAHAARAGWEFTPPGDPNRSWHASVGTGVLYDDNFNATQKNQQSGLKSSSSINLRAGVPLERFLMGVQYGYSVEYPRDINLGGVNQTHNLTASANYIVNPRLSLNLNENYVNSLQPELVLGPANAPVTVVQAGTYVYNNVAGGVSYAVMPRWILSLSGNWDIWRYQVPSTARDNDHEDYTTTLSALYALDPRTTVGLNYQYGENIYSNPGTNNGANASWDTAYLSVVRRFNPRLSASVNGGYTIRESGAGTTSTAPSAYGSFVYNYGPASTLSLTVAESLSSASLQFNRQFSTQQSTSFSLQANHRLTARLRAITDLTYTYSTFSQPIFPGLTLKPSQEALTAHLAFNYAFRDWLSAVFDYSYTQLVSSDSRFIQPYERNRVSVGLTYTY
jgi:hypothetical protein